MLGNSLGGPRRRRAAGGAEPPRAGNITAFPRTSDQRGRRAAAEDPRLSDRARRLHNLPEQLSSFVGREREIAEIKRLLETSRMLTLTGAGGIGKTRLAVRVASGLLEKYADGVWHVDLAALVDPALAPQAVANALGVREEPRRTLLATLSSYLQDGQVLLLLDNCEHVAGGCATLAAELLLACPRLRILATSRQALGTPGETAWRVPTLSLPGPGIAQTPESVIEYEAPSLFVERATSARSTFALSPQNAPAVAELCWRLDGIPLAIELAAVRVRALAVEQIVARIGDRFRLLKGGAAGPARHRTLWALVDWSYELLTEAERRLFRRLAAFTGGWTLEAAEAVCEHQETPARGDGGQDSALDLLEQLVDKSLVLADERHGEMRYRMLETIRQYADEQLRDSGDEAVARGLHRDWFLGLAETAESELKGPGEAKWLAVLEREHDNLRSALAWSQRDDEPPEARLRLATLLFRFWYVRGYLSEGRRWLEGALAGTGALRTPLKADALNEVALLAWAQGDYEKALALSAEGMALARSLGDRRGLAFSSSVRGRVLREQGDDSGAIECFEQCLACYREIADDWGIAIALENLGFVAWRQGDHERAAALAEEGLALCRKTGNKRGTAIALSDLGQVEWHRGNTREAVALLQESLVLLWELKDRRRIALVFDYLGVLASGRAEHGLAARLLGMAEALREVVGAELPAALHAERERAVAAARSGMGEETFARAWSAGQSMSPEQAIEYAASTEAARSAPPLSEREHQVVELITRGLSNREIAQELVISELTAETHVRNILRKLEFSTRAQVAAWAADQGPRA